LPSFRHFPFFMRAIKRWFRRWRAFQAARPALQACRPQLEQLFGGPVTWRHTGGRGRDVVCLVLHEGLPVGVLRLTHPGTPPSTPASAGQPFVSLGAAEKIEREWRAYAAGDPLGLTPKPLWRSAHAMLCAYVRAHPLQQEVQSKGASPLLLATDALVDIARLHAAGLTHMDMSLSNILRERSGGYRFVDFEYGAAAGLTFEQQGLYDYLRLLESIWKYLADEERKSVAATWGEAFRACAPEAVRAADLAPLRPALGRILAAPELASFFGAL
jgi:tRNA A-37 threonylcarbamoyl transferase component Bud32